MKILFFKKIDKLNLSIEKKYFLIISLGSFVLSFLFLNLIFYILNDEKLAAICTVIFVFIYNYYFLKKTFSVQENYKLFITLIILSLLFRFFEFYIFNSLLFFFKNINICWFICIVISFIIKFFVYPYTINKIR